MPPFASLLFGLLGGKIFAPQNVFSRGDSLKMIRIAAVRIFTKVIDHQTFGYVTFVDGVGEPVRKNDPPTNTDVANPNATIPIAIRPRGPQPAS
ncbi:MAG TPA: hypothetical protein VFU31_07870 [Candidatus Binatia bacterium]|nr:hypothetical protein [Candidatus Binatia bacterium]